MIRRLSLILSLLLIGGVVKNQKPTTVKATAIAPVA